MASNIERMKKYKVEQFPRSEQYDPDWVHKNEMGPNVLWFTESLTQLMDIKPEMRVLDLGCGTAMSSIFLAKEFDAQIWATDLWINATENLERIRKAGVEDKVFPIYAEAHALPYADEFFDVIVSLDSYHYYGNKVHYLEFYLLKLLKPGGQIGIVSPASPQKIPNPPPSYLGKEWYWLNTIDWWKEQWSRNPYLSVEHIGLLPQGWELWVRWNEFLCTYESMNPHNEKREMKQIIEDGGRYIGFVRMVATKKKF